MIRENMSHLHIFLMLILGALFLLLTDTTAQTSAYHSIVFPYDTDNRLVMTTGGIVSANPDPVTGIQLNSAGLAFYDNPTLFIGYSIRNSSYSLDYEYYDDKKFSEKFTRNPGYISFILPIFIKDKKIVLSGAFQGIGSPEIEIWEQIDSDQDLIIEHSRKGAVSKIDLSISSHIFKQLGIGMGLSKWSGNWSWSDQSDLETIGYGRFNYSGTSFNLTSLYQWSKVKIGILYYSPFQLMKSSKIRTTNWYSNDFQFLNQKFNGAARFGLIYLIKPALSIGIDYRWQDKITIENKYTDSLRTPNTLKYGESHQIATVLGKDFHWRTIMLPLYIGYQYNILPATPDNYTLGYQHIRIRNGHNDQHSVFAGLNIIYKSYGLYLAAGWKTGSVYIDDNYYIVPPWS
ncbi:MAG: hypothetical protein JW956_11685 [Calditrichaceae bacterium]|nr:hypothetical protein [Calditrichaceae bacterium]